MNQILPCWRRGLLLATLCLGATALVAQDTSVLKNPTFLDADGDGDPDNWKAYPPANSDTLVLASKPGGGLVFKDNDKANGLGLEQWIPVQEGFKYTASATVSGNGSVSLTLFFVAKIPNKPGDLGKIKLSDKSARAEAGKTTELVAVAPAGAKWAKLWLYCPKIGTTDVVVDKVSFTSSDAPVVDVAAAAPTTPTAATPVIPTGPVPEGNILKNPSFADADGDGTPDSWNPYPPGNGDTLVLAANPGGGLVFKDNDKGNGLGLEQWAPVQEGLLYTASANVSGNGAVSLTLIFAPSIPNRPGDLKKVQLSDKAARAEAGKTTTLLAGAPAGAKWVKVWLYCPKIGTTDVVINQISLTASKPAAAAASSASTATGTAAISAPKPLPAGLISMIDFETGDFSQARVTEGGDVSIVKKGEGPVRDGNFAAKSNLRLDKHRAEISSERSDAYGIARYGWSVYIPKEFDAFTHFSIITQWHSWGSGRESPKDGGPPTCINVSKGKVQLKLLHQGDDGWTSKADYFPVCSVEEMRGKWTDFVMEVNWQAPGNGGWLKLYMNDTPIIDYTGTTWYQDKDKGPYFKFGNYKGSLQWRGTEEGAILYFDSARMAVGDSSTYKMVDPATYAPRPTK
ncbi:MAG: polysaccharide lyase [Opitutaceae bacterium]